MLAVSSATANPLLGPITRLETVVATSLEQLLSRPLEFVEGSSSGILAVPEGRYHPINAARRDGPDSPMKSLAHATSTDENLQSQVKGALYKSAIPLHYPQDINNIGAGLLNIGNTCFLNSVLQCLLHSPPLLHLLREHEISSCRVTPGFCAICKMRDLMHQANGHKKFICPDPIVNNLSKIAKHFRRGRQEDAHEFLRYLIEAMQKSCLAGLGKVDHKLAETTWVYRLFGGRLRSRVKCRNCGHPSDTFDSVLDLSIDVNGVRSLKESLHKFVKLDVLKGADRYKCGKCKQFVVADKGFTVHDAPAILTIHLKRFTPFGRKIVNPVRYEEHLDLQPYMSEGQFGPMYRLFGVINHAGKGPNSGHYYSYVKSSKNRWYEMNDESVEPRHNVMAERNAYILLYIQESGQTLKQFTESRPVKKTALPSRPPLPKYGEEDVGQVASAPDIAGALHSLQPPALEGVASSVPSKADNDNINCAQPLAVGPNSILLEESQDEPLTMPRTTPSKSSPTLIDTTADADLGSTPTNTAVSPPTSLKRKNNLNPARLPNEDDRNRKTFKTNDGKRLPQPPTANPYGGRSQYKDNLKAPAPSDLKSFPQVWSRSAGLKKGMRKKKQKSLI